MSIGGAYRIDRSELLILLNILLCLRFFIVGFAFFVSVLVIWRHDLSTRQSCAGAVCGRDKAWSECCDCEVVTSDNCWLLVAVASSLWSFGLINVSINRSEYLFSSSKLIVVCNFELTSSCRLVSTSDWRLLNSCRNFSNASERTAEGFLYSSCWLVLPF